MLSFFNTITFGIAISSALLANSSPARFAERRDSLAQVITKCTVPNTAALTFDDGPYIYIQDISNLLIKAGAKGTFFFNGNNYGCIYADEDVERVKFAYSKGHMIGSHTWAHKDLTTLSKDEIDSEMGRVEQALQRIIGVTPAFTRPPYGNYNDLVRQVAHDHGQTLVNWDFDSGDSTGSTVEQSNAAYDQLANRHPSNILALNHETYNTTAHEVLPHAIKVLQSRGYKLVTVAECLGREPYSRVSDPQQGSWQC